MSLELETLDQLLGGDMALAVIRTRYPDDETFARSIHALCGVEMFAYCQSTELRSRSGVGVSCSSPEVSIAKCPISN